MNELDAHFAQYNEYLFALKEKAIINPDSELYKVTFKERRQVLDYINLIDGMLKKLSFDTATEQRVVENITRTVAEYLVSLA